jgi:hypothetical protein
MAKRLLDDVMVAAPCDVPWETMQGDERVRRCSGCSKNVYNISDMSEREAEELLKSHENPCLRLFRRADGNLITDNCPRGLRKLRDRCRKVAAAAAGLLATFLALAPVQAQNQPACTRGKPMMHPLNDVNQQPVRFTPRSGMMVPRTPRHGEDPPGQQGPHVQIWNAPAAGAEPSGAGSNDFIQSFEVGPDTSAMQLYTRAVNFERHGSTLLAKTLYREALEAAQKNKNSDPAFTQLLRDSVNRLDQELRGY